MFPHNNAFKSVRSATKPKIKGQERIFPCFKMFPRCETTRPCWLCLMTTFKTHYTLLDVTSLWSIMYVRWLVGCLVCLYVCHNFLHIVKKLHSHAHIGALDILKMIFTLSEANHFLPDQCLGQKSLQKVKIPERVSCTCTNNHHKMKYMHKI